MQDLYRTEPDRAEEKMNYIHNNPVAATLVQNKCDWEFSSAQDYALIRNGTLVNKQMALKVGLKWEHTH